MAFSHAGAKLSGSSTPGRRRSGSDTVKISGANASSLPSHSATAYETAVIIRPRSASSPSIKTIPHGWMLSPNGSESRISSSA